MKNQVDFIRGFVNMDETSVLYYTPESKEMSYYQSFGMRVGFSLSNLFDQLDVSIRKMSQKEGHFSSGQCVMP